MGLFGPRQRRDFYGIDGAADLIPARSPVGMTPVANKVVTNEQANKHSVVWACTRLQSGLMSTFPIDQFRDVPVGGEKIQVEMPGKPPILTDPGGTKMPMIDFMAATDVDLIQSGNAVGLIVERSAIANRYHPKGLPYRIELASAASCTYIKPKDKAPFWRINGKDYDPSDVYHERANVVAGLDVGLPTNLYASLSVSEGLSMQTYGTSWFTTGGLPKAHLQNQKKFLKPGEAEAMKGFYHDFVANGDIFVTGVDWEFNLLQAQQAGAEFFEGRNISNLDVCRFYGVAGDLVDVNASSSSITYANITQRNLQYLILQLGPRVIAREAALSRLLPTPRYVKMNTDALLRMDPQTQAQVIKTRTESFVLTNAEARALDNRKPLTEEEKRESIELYGKKSPSSGGQTDGGGDQGGNTGADQGSGQPATSGSTRGR